MLGGRHYRRQAIVKQRHSDRFDEVAIDARGERLFPLATHTHRREHDQPQACKRRANSRPSMSGI